MRVTPDMDTINSFEICAKIEIQTYPSVVFDGQNYIVVWSDNNFGGSYYYVAAARVTPGGVVLDTGACITSGVGSSEYRARIAYDGNRCLVVWPKSSGPIYGRFINSDCQPEGDIFIIGFAPAGGPNIAFDGSNYLVVWYTGTYPGLELYGHLVSPQGALVGSPISIAHGSGCHRWGEPFSKNLVHHATFCLEYHHDRLYLEYRQSAKRRNEWCQLRRKLLAG